MSCSFKQMGLISRFGYKYSTCSMFQSYNNKLLFSISFEPFIIQLITCCIAFINEIFPLIQVKKHKYVRCCVKREFSAICEHCRLRSNILKRFCEDFEIFFKGFAFSKFLRFVEDFKDFFKIEDFSKIYLMCTRFFEWFAPRPRQLIFQMHFFFFFIFKLDLISH